MAMMAMTTRSSIKVKALLVESRANVRGSEGSARAAKRPASKAFEFPFLIFSFPLYVCVSVDTAWHRESKEMDVLRGDLFKNYGAVGWQATAAGDKRLGVAPS